MVMVKVKIDGHIQGLTSNRDIANWISNLENTVNLMAKVKMDGHIWDLAFKA